MASIAPRRGLPTLYPDWSTLVDAFRAVSGDSPRPGAGTLAAVLEDTSRRANLCLSFAHLLELLRGADVAERRDRAAWIDGLDVVWLKDLDAVQDLEVERYLLRSFGCAADVGLPSSSFLAQFPFGPQQIPDLLKLSGVSAWVEGTSDRSALSHQLESLAAHGPAMARQFFVDRRRAAEDGLTPAQLEVRLLAKRAESLVPHALRVHQVLLKRTDYAVRHGPLFRPPSEEDVREAVLRLQSSLTALPSVHLFYRALKGIRRVSADATNLAQPFFQRAERKSDIFDLWHLVGAAYCTVFVCDSATAGHIGSARADLQLPRQRTQRTFGGNLAAFADALRADLGL